MHVNRSAGLGLAAAACAAVTVAVGGAAENQAIGQIERYCAASWRNARIERSAWPDCTQQAFADLLQRVSRRELVEAIENASSRQRRALNRSIWCVISRWRRTPRLYPLEANDPPDRRSARSAQAPYDAERLAAAIDRLAPRQRAIVELWSQGCSIAEIACQLAIPPARVSDEKYKAVQALRRRLG